MINAHGLAKHDGKTVAAVVPQSGQVSAPVGFLPMVLDSVVVLGLAAVFSSHRDP